MVRYYDSSIILAGILGQKPHDLIVSLWDPVEIRLSSILIKMECLIAIRRTGAMQDLPQDGPWCRERIRLLEPYLEELDSKRIDDEILEIIKETPSLSNCRSVDAIHVATALYFKPYHEGPIEMVTLDGRMRETAKKAGFTVLPSTSVESPVDPPRPPG